MNRKRIRDYDIQEDTPNLPEIKLISYLKSTFADELGKIISNTELGEIFGYRKLITKALRNESKFVRSTVFKMENIVKKKLSANNKKRALETIRKYKEERGLILEITPEMELIESLHNIFSRELGRIISYTELSTILGNPSLISLVIRNKSKFLEKTLIKFKEIIEENLIGEDKKNALEVIIEYKEKRESIWTEELKKKQSILAKEQWKDEDFREKQVIAKSTKEWKQKQSDMAKNLWKNEKYVQKQKMTRNSKDYREKKSVIMKNLFENLYFKKKHKEAQLRGPDHPGWNPNRNEVMQPYGAEWYEFKKEQITAVYKEQCGRDGVTGEKFTQDDILHRHHIYYDKGNYQLERLILLMNSSHGKVQNPPHPNSKKWSNLFQQAKDAFARGEPPKYWLDLYKKLFLQERKRQTELNEY